MIYDISRKIKVMELYFIYGNGWAQGPIMVKNRKMKDKPELTTPNQSNMLLLERDSPNKLYDSIVLIPSLGSTLYLL
jgi:hypothetical protein